MTKIQQNKPLYIGIATTVLLLFLIIGGLLYNSSPKSVKKDNTVQNTTTLSSDDSSKNASLQKPSARLGDTPIQLSAVTNTCFLIAFTWLSVSYAASQTTENQSNNAKFVFALSQGEYIAIAVVGIAIVGATIGCFIYQKYYKPSMSISSAVRDGGIIAALSLLTSLPLALLSFGPFQYQKQDNNKVPLSFKLLEKIGIACVVNVVTYLFATNVIAFVKSNYKLKWRWTIDHIRLYAIVILTGIWGLIVEAQSAWSSYLKMSWAIPACFLYIQAFWDPALSDIPPKRFANCTPHKGVTIGLAALFHPSHLWEGLTAVLAIYHLGCDFWSTIGFWGAWALWKWGFLYHLEIEKDTDTEVYTVNFPLDLKALLEGAALISFGLYLPLHLYLAESYLDNTWAQTLCLTTLLIAGLWLKLYLNDSKKPWAQWASHGAYLSLIISGATAAFFYVNSIQVPNEGSTMPIAKLILGEGGFLLLILYCLPKCLNGIAKAALAYKTSYKDIALLTEMASDFWLLFSKTEIIYIILLSIIGTASKQFKTIKARLVHVAFLFTLGLVVTWYIKLGLIYFSKDDSENYLRILEGDLGKLLVATSLLYAEYKQGRLQKALDNYSIYWKVLLGGCFLVAIPYIFAKSTHMLTSFGLTWAKHMPSKLQTIARALQGFSAFYLQPHPDVVCTAIVSFAGAAIYTYKFKKAGLSYQNIFITYLYALGLYSLVQLISYNLPPETPISAIIEDHSSFCIAFAGIVLNPYWNTAPAYSMISLQRLITIYRQKIIQTLILPLLGAISCYVAIAACIYKFNQSIGIKSAIATVYSLPYDLWQWCLQLGVWLLSSLRGLLFPAGTSTDEDETTAPTTPQDENIIIALLAKNFPALFGLGILLLSKSYPKHLKTTEAAIAIAALVGIITFFYITKILGQLPSKQAITVLAAQLCTSLVFTLAFYLFEYTDDDDDGSLTSYSTWGGLILGCIIVLAQIVMFYKERILYQPGTKISGFTFPTCIATLHLLGYLYYTTTQQDQSNANPAGLIAKMFIAFCSSFIVLVSIFDTLKLPAGTTTRTWSGWLTSKACIYLPNILCLCYGLVHPVYTENLDSNTQRILACMAIFLLITGFKQLKVVTQADGSLRLLPIAIDHQLLANDLFRAFLLSLCYAMIAKDNSTEDDEVSISYEDMLSSMLWMLIVRWGLCNGLITHLPQPAGTKGMPARFNQYSLPQRWALSAVQGMLVSTCFLWTKGKSISQNREQFLALSLVASGIVGLLLAYTKELALGISASAGIRDAVGHIFDFVYYNQNEIITFFMMNCLRTMWSVSVSAPNTESLNNLIDSFLDYFGTFFLLVCIVFITLLINTLSKSTISKIFTHLAFGLCLGYTGNIQDANIIAIGIYVLSYILLALAVEALHPIPTQGQVDDIKHGVLTQMNKHHMLLGALYGLTIDIIPTMLKQQMPNLFTYETLLYICLGVLLSIIIDVYGKSLAQWFRQERHTGWIQEGAILCLSSIAICIRLGIAENKLSTIPLLISSILVSSCIMSLYVLCKVFIVTHMQRLFTWVGGDVVVDYYPLASVKK